MSPPMMFGPKPARRTTNQRQYVRPFTSHVTGTEMNDRPLMTSQAQHSQTPDAAPEQPGVTAVPAKTFKNLLSSAPLEGIDLDRQTEVTN